MAKNVLITGGLGYFGSVLAPYLCDRGFRVTVLDTGFFRDCTLYPPRDPHFVLRDARDVSEADLEGHDAVVHLAGISNDPFGNLPPERIYDPTRAYAGRIAQLCKKRGMRFIFASSCSVYGRGEGAVLDEDSPPHPQTPYSRNKLEIEEDLASLADASFSPVALRFATAFGLSPRMRFDIVVNMFAGMAYTGGTIVLNSDGQAWRPNVYVADMSAAVEHTLREGYSGGRLLVLNVGREDNNMKIADIARLVAEECGGAPISLLGGVASPADELVSTKLVKAGGADTRNYRVSFERIRRVFPDLTVRHTVREGVREMLARFRETGLTGAQFRDHRFHRLQRIESLLASGKLNADLRFNS